MNHGVSVRTREVVFPRFKLEQNYDLVNHLKQLGLTELFTEKGDFSPMAPEKVSVNWVRQDFVIKGNPKRIYISLTIPLSVWSVSN